MTNMIMRKGSFIFCYLSNFIWVWIMRTTLLLLIVGLFVSCSKEKRTTQEYFYHDFIPDTVFPMPAVDDVTYNFTLQVGPDTSDAIEITLKTASDYSAHMPVTDYWIRFSMPDTTMRFIDPEVYHFGPCPSPLDSGTIISPSSPTMGGFSLYVQDWNWPEGQFSCSSMEQGGYIGYWFFSEGHYYMGWLWAKVNTDLSVTVDDYCYSLLPDTPFGAGIKE
jgi:hypothetical protein